MYIIVVNINIKCQKRKGFCFFRFINYANLKTLLKQHQTFLKQNKNYNLNGLH